MAALLNSLFFAFTNSFLPKYSVKYYDYIIKWRSGIRLLGRILKVGVQNFKQGVQGSNVHVLFNPVSPRRSPFLSRETPRRSPISRSRC